DVAENFFRKLVRVTPNVADYHIARGVCLGMLRSKEAAREFELGLALAPNDQTGKFLAALHALKSGDTPKSKELLESLLPTVTAPHIMHITNRLATAVYYVGREYDKALMHAERVLASAISEGWEKEEYDARLTVAYMAMLAGSMEKASENLLELEIRNPSDELVIKISDFRMDLEEGVAQPDKVSPRGFDFYSHMQDWLRRRFPDDALFKLSGLQMDDRFNVLDFFTRDGVPRARATEQMVDPGPYIEKFNSLKDEAFMVACENIIGLLGFRIEKSLPYRDRDGADFVAVERGEKKSKALFRIRKWKNQPISDIFLRDMQNFMNENKTSAGFVVAGARLTSGAEEALKNLRKITVINAEELGTLLQKVLK
ncbi:MAG: restriction endonuclease, partial [Spirochaetia bacterium]|nr:restriction endonuclease [Spirochaetia bacterium]